MSRLNNIVMFACNEGGHFSQMMALNTLFNEYECVLVTDNVHANQDTVVAIKNIKYIEYAMSIAKKRRKMKEDRVKKTGRLQYLISYLSLLFECQKIWNKYKPKVIISTGSNIAVGLFIYGWIKGSKLIFIETRAKVYSKTITGKIVGKFANKIFVQWPDMIKVYPNAEYCGTLV